MNNQVPLKEIVTVTELARMCNLSRARFYQLIGDQGLRQAIVIDRRHEPRLHPPPEIGLGEDSLPPRPPAGQRPPVGAEDGTQ